MPIMLEDFTVVTSDYVPTPDSIRNLGSEDNSFADCWLDGTLHNDIIVESTPAAGVTVESVLLKDGYIDFANATLPVGTRVYMGRDNAGDLSLNALAGKTLNIAIAGTDEYNFSATTLAMNANTITGAGDIICNNAAGPTLQNEAATTINPTLIPNRADETTGIGWNTAEVHIVISGADEYGFTATTLNMRDNALDNCGYIILNAATAPAGTEVYLVNDNSGDLTLNALVNKVIDLSNAGAPILRIKKEFVSFLKDIQTDRWLSHDDNVFIGVNTAGHANLAHSVGAEGWQNTAVGYDTLYEITAGHGNTAIGFAAMRLNTIGFNNTAIGFSALAANTSAYYNVAVGYHCLDHVTIGGYNIGIGYRAGNNITTGESNIVIGKDVDAPSATADFQIEIGDGVNQGRLRNDNAGDWTIYAPSTKVIKLQAYGDVDDYITISTNNENVPSIYGTGAYLRIGDAATTQHTLASEDDLMVTGKLEVGGISYLDGDIVCAGYIGLLVTDTDGATEGEIWYDASENTLKVCTGSVDSVVLLTATQILTNKTLTTPTIADLTNMTHAHTSAATGGDYAWADFVANDVTYLQALVADITQTNLVDKSATESITGTWTLASPTINGTIGTSGLTMPAFTLGGAVACGDQGMTGVGDMTFTAGSILATGATEGNTLLIKAGGLSGATFITLTANDTLDVCELDACTLDASIGKGTWTVSGIWTLPAMTFGGLVTSTSTTGFATTATFAPDSTRTNYAYSIGNRATELTVNLANDASQNFEPFQMNINLTASGGAPTSTSTVRLIRVRSTHDTVDMPNLRIMNLNTYMDVQKNIQAAYGQMNGVDFTTNTLTITTEAAVSAFNMECTSTVTGNVRGIIVNLHGATLPSTSIGLEVRTDGGSATLGEGVRIWSVGSCSINYGLYIDGTINTADIRFSGGTTLVDDGTSLTLAGANFVSTLGATTLAGTVTVNGQAFDAGSANVEIDTTGIGQGLVIQSTNTGVVGAMIQGYHRSTARAAGDIVLQVYGKGREDDNTDRGYAIINLMIEDPAVANPKGKIEWQCYLNSEFNTAMTLSAAGVVSPDHSILFGQSQDSGAVADQVSLAGFDISEGHRALAISSEETVITEAAGAADRSYPVRINGVNYKILLVVV